MSNLTISDVTKEDFDPKNLWLTEEEKLKIELEIDRARDAALKAKIARYPSMSNPFVYDSEIVHVLKFSSSDLLSLIFSREFYSHFILQLSARNSFSWALNEKIHSFVKSNATISNEVFLKSHLSSLRDFLIMEGLMDIEDIEKAMLSNKGIAGTLHKSSTSHLFDLFGIDFAQNFISHNDSDVRKAAYKKVGIYKCIDNMISDSDAEIRLIAARAMPYNDPRHERFINDRSSKVFAISLSKIDRLKLPLLLGSTHLKKAKIKAILNNRMLS